MGRTYARHGVSVLLVWNVVLSVVVAYIFFRRNPAGVVFAAMPSAQGWGEKGHQEHQLVVGFMVAGILGFTGYVLIRLVAKRCCRKNKAPQKDETTLETGEPGRKEENPAVHETQPLQGGAGLSRSEGCLEVDEGTLLALARGQSVTLIRSGSNVQ